MSTKRVPTTSNRMQGVGDYLVVWTDAMKVLRSDINRSM